MKENYYAVDRSDEYLAHYGIKGMRWGVRKARESGNAQAMARQFRKAEKKLAKLEKRAASGKKYAARAAGLGAGAALAGTVAASGVGNVVGKGMHAAGTAANKTGMALMKSNNATIRKIGSGLYKTGRGAQVSSINTAASINRWGKKTHDLGKEAHIALNSIGLGSAGNNLHKAMDAKNIGKNVSNDKIARIGAAAAAAGLGSAAAYNAYRAATTKRAAKKAAAFRAEMQKSFAGTKYANQVGAASVHKKKRR